MLFRASAALVLLMAPTAASAEWWEARTDNFIVYSESSAKDARAFAERLQRFEMALRSLQNIGFAPERSDSTRLTVYRSGKIADISRLIGYEGVAGFYIPRVQGPVAFTPAVRERGEKGAAYADRRGELDPQTVLFHEYSHHFMYRHFSAAYPAWYREGFAEAYSTIDLKNDGSFHLGNAPQSRGSELVGSNFNYSIQRMLLSADKPDGEDVYGRYSYGWLLTHYLTFAPSRKGQLQTYLRAINQGTPAAQAAEKSFGDLKKLESDVRTYLNGQLPGASVRPANYSPPTVALRKLGPDEEAVMPIKMRSEAMDARKRSADIARDALAVAARFPQSFAAQVLASEAALDAEQFVVAERSADAAITLKPGSSRPMILKAVALLEQGRANRAKNAEARTWLVKARQADANDPSVLYYNYISYAQEGGGIPEQAVIGLERSFKQAPYDDEVRLAVIAQLLAEKNGPVARQLMAPLVHSPHESKGAMALRRVYDLIAANKLDEAYKGLVAEVAAQEQERKAGKERGG